MMKAVALRKHLDRHVKIAGRFHRSVPDCISHAAAVRRSVCGVTSSQFRVGNDMSESLDPC